MSLLNIPLRQWRRFGVAFAFALAFSAFASASPARADSARQTLPFSQDWANTGLITANDDWSGVAGIVGFLGQDITTVTGTDPQTLLGVSAAANDLDVIANQTNPGITNGGVAEFQIADSVVALQGSGTADAPHIIVYLDTTGQSSITIGYDLRDIDGTTDNAVQPVALQYRVGSSGNFTNIPAGFVADATTGPSLATLVTHVSASLPTAADNQPEVQVRIITTNAVGNDEWVGIDNIAISGSGVPTPTNPTGSGTAAPNSVTAGGSTLLTVAVTPGANPTSTGLAVSADLTAIGGSATQAFFDDGSNGDVTAGDNTFSFQATVDGGTSAGVKSLPFTVSDAQARSSGGSIGLTVQSATPCATADTPIGQVQGTGDITPLSGQTVTVQGVVVGDYEGASPKLRGFYLQDTGDGDAGTSDGIFVFEGDNADRVSDGQLVQVTGPASENQGQTQISSTTGVELCGTTGTVTPTDVSMPFASATALEAYEGMLVRFPQTLYVTEHFQLGRFGEILMSSNGRRRQPTNVVAPGAPANALQAANDLNKIIVDDDNQAQNSDPIQFGRGGNPLSASNTLRGGDTATGMVGVMSYTWAGNAASGNAYRLRPIGALGGGVPTFQPANPRPSSAPAVGGTLHVAGMNLLNFFNTFSGCTSGVGGAATDCRGAESQVEFDRQWPKTVAAILGIGADIIGVNEIENDGYGPNSAIQFLVDKLNAATAPGTYAFIDVDANTGQVNALGTDAIKVGMIYKPAKVMPVGQTAALNSVAFVNGGDSAPRSRPSLAQAFEQNSNGARFIVDLNHLKSKGSACNAPDAGDGQGNCNTVRVNAATALMAWLASDPTGTNDPDILMVGDYNSYAMEDPITVIKNAGFTNLISAFLGPDAYSYVFDGQWGYLDHALGSASIVSQVTGVGDYHINSDEPSVLDYNTNFKSSNQLNTLYAPDQFRMSDHDSVLVGLSLQNASPVAADDSYTTAEDTPLTVAAPGVLGNDTDAEGNSLTAALVDAPSAGQGTMTLNADGSFTFTPAANFNGTATFTYKANDGQSDSNVATVSIAVTAVNDAPVATNDNYTTAEDAPLNVAAPAVLANDQDVDGDPLTAALVSGPSHGTLTLNSDGSFMYTPQANFSGADSFTYKANDGTADSTVATVSINVTPVNDAPTIVVAAGGQCLADFRGLANLTIGDLETAPGSLTLSGSSSNTTLVPNANITFGGSGANRTVTIATAAGKSGSATVTIGVDDGTTTTAVTIRVIAGTNSSDALNGGSGTDMLFGGNAPDVLIGGGGIDLLCGGNGNDALTGGSGDDTLDGGSGNDILTGNDGNDALTGGSGDDLLLGGQGNDSMLGGQGNDILTGGSGADLFDGGANIDIAIDFNAGEGDTKVNIP